MTERNKDRLLASLSAVFFIWMLAANLWWGVRHPHCSDIARLSHLPDVVLFQDTPECK